MGTIESLGLDRGDRRNRCASIRPGRDGEAVPCELLRTMPVTMIVGQGAGVTAAVAVRDGATPRDVDISHVQQELRAQGVRL